MSMTLIQTVTVGSGGAANITFSSIPATFTDLLLVLSLQTPSSAGTKAALLRPNSATTGLSSRLLYGNGSSAISASDSLIPLGFLNRGNVEGTTTFSSYNVYLPNYASSTAAKSISSEGVTEHNATTAYQMITAGLYNSTTPITSLLIREDGSDGFTQHSSASLYGITSGSSGGVIVS